MIDSGTEIIRFPKDGYLMSAALTEESIHILTKGMQFEEAFGVERVDLTIDKSDKIVPTIGLLDRLSPSSGRLLVLTDSSCLDSASATLTKCYWLADRFVKLATSDPGDSFLMQERYKLPLDYQTNERPKKQTLEEVDFSQLQLYRQSRLNSWNQTCANK